MMIETHTTKFIEPDYIETPIGMVVIELLNVFIQFGIEFSKSVDIINMYPTRVAARYGPSFGSIQDSKDLLKINFYPKTPLNNDQFNKIKMNSKTTARRSIRRRSGSRRWESGRSRC